MIFRQILDEVQKLESLPANWDSYGAPPLDRKLTSACCAFAIVYEHELKHMPRVVPTAKGGVQLEWIVGDRELEIEYEDYRTIHYLQVDNATGFEHEGIVDDSNEAAVRDLLQWLDGVEVTA